MSTLKAISTALDLSSVCWQLLKENESIVGCRTPLSLPGVGARNLFFRPSIMLQGLLAHYAAEALLNAPAVLGSLELLLNPTGLLHSVGQGFEDLVSLPMAALQAGSPAQVSLPFHLWIIPKVSHPLLVMSCLSEYMHLLSIRKLTSIRPIPSLYFRNWGKFVQWTYRIQ